MGIKVIPNGKRRDGSEGWSLVIDGTRAKPDAYTAFGLPKSLTISEAKVRLESIRANQRLKKQESKIAAVAERKSKERDEAIAFLPQADIQEFETNVLAPKFLGLPTLDPKHKTAIRWQSALKVLAEVKLTPADWYQREYQFYIALERRQYSPDYANRIITLLNLYGFFYCHKYLRPFAPIPKLGKRHRGKQAMAASKAGRGKKSKRLTPEMLEAQKSNLLVENYNWLFVSVWLGLRPEEVDTLVKPEPGFESYLTEASDETPILNVYQPKLAYLEDEDKKWKRIPLLLPEMLKAHRLIQQGQLRRPLNKTMRKYFGARLTCYAGRKGFMDLMQSLDQDPFNISQWMGHTTLNRSFKDYKDKSVVHFNKPKKAA